MKSEHTGSFFDGIASAALRPFGVVATSQCLPVANTKPKHLSAQKKRTFRRDQTFAPDFLVIGAMKAGTTTLCHYLAQFAEISISRNKETDYFVLEKNFALGEAWYQGQFDLTRQLVGEASPNYAKYDIFPGVPERIAGVAPHTKFIFIVRDPVARFASHYRHSWTHGHMRVNPTDLLASNNGRHMVECSRYAVQIEKYLAHFDRQQFLFLDFDELCDAPQRVGDQVSDFLGINRRIMQHELPANTADQIAQVPAVLKRAARTKIVSKLDYLIPKLAHDLVRATYHFRKPDSAPVLEPALLDEVAELLKADALNFREIAGKEFSQWRV